MKKIIIECEKQDKVLNIVSRSRENISYSTANKLLRQKDIRLNGKKISENIVANAGDEITLFMPDNAPKMELKLDIPFENEQIVVVNKQKGVEVSVDDGVCIEKALKEKYRSENKQIFVEALNRIDRNTEGLVIFAKGKENYSLLRKAMKNGEIHKSYLAEIVGVPKFDYETKTAFLLKDDEKCEVRIFDKPFKDSVKITTTISVISRSAGGTSIVEAEIKNGKTHQIRAHLAHLGFPIIGDGKYGKNEDNKKFKAKTQKLTAYKLEFSFSDAKLKNLNTTVIQIKPTWLNF